MIPGIEMIPVPGTVFISSLSKSDPFYRFLPNLLIHKKQSFPKGFKARISPLCNSELPFLIWKNVAEGERKKAAAFKIYSPYSYHLGLSLF